MHPSESEFGTSRYLFVFDEENYKNGNIDVIEWGNIENMSETWFRYLGNMRWDRRQIKKFVKGQSKGSNGGENGSKWYLWEIMII